MAYLQSLPAPHSIYIKPNVAEKWSKWKEMWLHYGVAPKVNKEDGEVQVAARVITLGLVLRLSIKNCST